MKRCERSLDKKLNRRNKGASLVAQLVKNLPVIQESLDQFLVFRIPWRSDRIFTPVFLGFSGGIRLQCWTPGFDPWVGKIPWSRPWQPTPVFLPVESPRTQEPGGLQSMGFRVGHNRATKHSTVHENKSIDINKINHVNNGLWMGEGWEGGSRRRGHIYSYVWFPLLYGRNQHYIVKQLASK